MLQTSTMSETENDGTGLMPVECCYCHRVYRHKPALGTAGTSSGICRECFERNEPELAEILRGQGRLDSMFEDE